MRRQMRGISLGVFASLLVCGIVSAEHAPEIATGETGWAVLMKLGRGIGNAAGGWMEIPYTMHNRWDSNDVPTSFFSGVLIGIVKGVARTVIGVFEIATFPFPIPPGYAPILSPM